MPQSTEEWITSNVKPTTCYYLTLDSSFLNLSTCHNHLMEHVSPNRQVDELSIEDFVQERSSLFGVCCY